MQIHHRRQIEPPFSGADIGNIRHPNLVGPGGLRQMDQPIGRDRLIMPAVGCPDAKALSLPPTNLLLSHQPLQTVASMSLATSAQNRLDARSSISLPTLLMDLADLLFEPLILLPAQPRLPLPFLPVIISTGGNAKGLAQCPDGMLASHDTNPFIPLLWGSERMPNVFFKISRCWRRNAFSRRKAANSSSSFAGEAGVTGP